MTKLIDALSFEQKSREMFEKEYRNLERELENEREKKRYLADARFLVEKEINLRMKKDYTLKL